MSDNTPQLPCVLSRGVLATREGLIFHPNAPIAMAACIAAEGHEVINVGMRTTWTWPDAAERLRYREGEPYCELFDVQSIFRNETPYQAISEGAMQLHRLAAILCKDTEAFSALHWCIHNLGGQDE